MQPDNPPGAAMDEETPLLKAKTDEQLEWKSFGATLLRVLDLEHLTEAYGYKLIVLLFVVQHLLKGFVNQSINSASDFLYSSYGVTGPSLNLLDGIALLPWSMKPVIGRLSDACPIMGYKRTPYMILYTLGGIYALSILGFLPQGSLTLNHAVVCMFLARWHISSLDLLSEARYSEKTQDQPQLGPALMSYVWFGLTAFQTIAALVSGPILSTFGFKTIFAMLTPIAAIGLLPLIYNYMEEHRQTAEETENSREALARESEILVISIISFCCSVAIFFVGILFQSPVISAVTSLAVLLLVVSSFGVLLRPVIAKVAIFLLLRKTISFSNRGSSFYFYTDTPEMYPAGPHFSRVFYALRCKQLQVYPPWLEFGFTSTMRAK